MGNKNEGEQKPSGDAGGKSPGGKGKGGGYPAPAAASGSKGGGKGEKTETYAEKKAREAEEQMKKQVDEFAAPADFADKAPASERLTKEEKAILEESATERAGTGTYDKFYPTQGYFACKKCGTPIYSYEAKFNSGCGWPAFDKCYEGAIKTVQEPDGRTEIRCDFCDSHLGHVFSEKGYKDQRSGERHCANSRALQFVKQPPKDAKEEAPVLKKGKM